jgi:hypothetical protein
MNVEPDNFGKILGVRVCGVVECVWDYFYICSTDCLRISFSQDCIPLMACD